MLPFFLFLPFQLLQTFQFFGFEELVNTTKMFLYFLVSELINLGHKAIQEITVV